jgi:hypothetical protein
LQNFQKVRHSGAYNGLELEKLDGAIFMQNEVSFISESFSFNQKR